MPHNLSRSTYALRFTREVFYLDRSTTKIEDAISLHYWLLDIEPDIAARQYVDLLKHGTA